MTRAFEVAQWMKVLAARPGDLSLIPELIWRTVGRPLTSPSAHV